MARPQKYTDKTKVGLSTPNKAARLNKGSERRAIVEKVVDNGGKMSLGDIDKAFGFDMRTTVLSLVRSGWLEIIQ